MAVEDIIEPTRETRFTYKKSDKEETYVIREPTPDEVNLCDIFRSKVWYDCMKKGIATEEEILDMLKNQGRFNLEKFETKAQELSEKNALALQKMAMVDSLEELDEAYKEASKAREESIEHRKLKTSFTRHSVEVRSDHAYNMVMMGMCVEKINGKPVFAVYDDVNHLDIDKTFEKVDGWRDIPFINAALTSFLPFIMGSSDGNTKTAEDIIYDTMVERFKDTKDEDDQEEEDNEETVDIEVVKKPKVEKFKEPVIVEQETEKDPVPEPEAEKDPVIIDDDLGLGDDDDEIFEPTSTLLKSESEAEPVPEPKQELLKANNRPKMSPAPTQERLTVKAGQHNSPPEDSPIDSTGERTGFRTGDEDVVGDGSAMPGGAPITTRVSKD